MKLYMEIFSRYIDPPLLEARGVLQPTMPGPGRKKFEASVASDNAEVDFSATSREGGTGGPEYTQTVKVTPARGQEAGALKQTVQMSAGEFRSRHLTRVDKALARNAACKNWLDQQLAATTAPLTCTVHSPGRQSRQMGYVDETVVTTVLANHTVELKVREAFDFYSMK